MRSYSEMRRRLCATCNIFSRALVISFADRKKLPASQQFHRFFVFVFLTVPMNKDWPVRTEPSICACLRKLLLFSFMNAFGRVPERAVLHIWRSTCIPVGVFCKTALLLFQTLGIGTVARKVFIQIVVHMDFFAFIGLKLHMSSRQSNRFVSSKDFSHDFKILFAHNVQLTSRLLQYTGGTYSKQFCNNSGCAATHCNCFLVLVWFGESLCSEIFDSYQHSVLYRVTQKNGHHLNLNNFWNN